MKSRATSRVFRLIPLLLLCAAIAFPQDGEGDMSVFASDLLAPFDILSTPGGQFIVAEGGDETSGRVSILTSGGTRLSLIEGLPGGISGEGAPAGASGVALDGSTLFIAIGEGDAFRKTDEGVALPNPAGVSSPLISAVIEVTFSADVDTILTGFTLTPANHWTMADGLSVEMVNADGVTATARLLNDFQNSTPDSRVPYRASNPFGVAVIPGRPDSVYVNDASQNTIVKLDRESGRSQVVIRFPGVPHPVPTGPPVAEFVPTSITPYANNLLVTNLVGFPFPRDQSTVQFVDLDAGTATPFIAELTSLIDAAVVTGDDGVTRFYTLEFSQEFLRNLPGRLFCYDTPAGRLIAGDLVSPTSMTADPATGDILVTQLGPGNVVRVSTQ